MKKILSVALAILLFVSAPVTQTVADSDEAVKGIIDRYETHYEDGGKDVVFIIDGIENHCLVPPEGFDPLSASDEELERYCFPARPEDTSEVREWISKLAHYRSTPEPELTVTWVTPRVDEEIKKISDGSNVMTKSQTSYSVRCSRIWSGYETNLGSSPANTYSQVEMDFTQPTISSATGSCLNSYWVGLGGRNSKKLVQAGTATSGTSNHYAWYEYLTDVSSATSVPMQIISSLTIHAGDSVHTYISFEKENNKFTYYIANDTTGNAQGGYVNLNANSYYDGTTAEWIVERCSNLSGDPYNMGNYGSIAITNCKYKFLNVSGWNNMENASGLYNVVMTSTGSYSGTVLSNPSAPYSNNCYTCIWHNYY